MKKKIQCKICGKEVTSNNSYLGSHTKRVHNLALNEYVKKYYKSINHEFKPDTCGFCDREAHPNFIIDHDNFTYDLNYENGFLCYSEECRDKISQLIFGEPYDKKKYEHIGSNSKYLSLLYKKNISDINYKKSKGFRLMTFKTSLEGFIKKYGQEKGEQKYYERNKKIGKSATLNGYIEKYGEEMGKIKWEEHIKKIPDRFGQKKSKSSLGIEKILNLNNIKFISEYGFTKENSQKGYIDYYLEDYNTIIEFYGDFWHCNPNIFKKNYYHKILKKSANEIWEKDDNRIKYIYEKVFDKKISILIIWESTKFSEKYFMDLLENTKNKNIILEI